MNSFGVRTVRVFLCFSFGVVLAMHRDPLIGHHPGGQPQPESKAVSGDRMQGERSMRLTTVQKNRDRDNGEVRQHQSQGQVAPPREPQQTGGDVHGENFSTSNIQ